MEETKGIEQLAKSFDPDLAKRLLRSASSGEMRDVATSELFGSAITFAEILCSQSESSLGETFSVCCELILKIFKFPEIEDFQKSLSPPSPDFLKKMVAAVTSQTQHRRFWKFLLSRFYQFFPALRPELRRQVSLVLENYSRCPAKSLAISPLLQFLGEIIRGAKSPLGQVYVDLVRRILLPLHRPNSWSLWDRQEPLLGEYHKPLVFCVFEILKNRIEIFSEVFLEIFKFFPPPSQANTAKELLLFTEIEGLLDFEEASQLIDTRVVSALLERIGVALRSENAQTIQAVLQLWKKAAILEISEKYKNQIFPEIISALFRGGQPHWNPTVNKMTYLVLTKLKEIDTALFSEISVSLKGQAVSDPSPAAAPLPVADAPGKPRLGLTGVAPWRFEASSAANLEISSFGMSEFLEKIKPDFSQIGNPQKSWEIAMEAENPIFLENLKFYNLVFGKDLGRGAFAVVKYARAVDKATALSQWPEFAVKTVDDSPYARKNVFREICILRRLSHPSIGRLVSFYRLGAQVHLVLEYAALGDLHSLVVGNGKLSEDEGKRVFGEVVAGLMAVHAQGFVYADLKPENVVITSGRRLKLVDFGAARPVTAKAKEELVSARNEFLHMRSGAWNPETDQGDLEVEDFSENDAEFEGTTAYMAPELIRGGSSPGYIADAWSLGVFLYFCLQARLPNWLDEDEEAMKSKIVRFSWNQQKFSDDISEEAKNLILSLICPKVEDRLSVPEASNDPWIASLPSVASLYKSPVPPTYLVRAASNKSKESSEDPWAKRQLSKIWTTKPEAYDFSDSATAEILKIEETDFERDSPFVDT